MVLAQLHFTRDRNCIYQNKEMKHNNESKSNGFNQFNINWTVMFQQINI